jgi:DNA polymerase-3 subunit gamma/tau
MTVIITESTNTIESADIFKKRYLDYLGKFNEGDILRLLNFLNKTGQELRYSQNQKLKIEIALCHLVGLEKTSTISELIKSLNDGNIEPPLIKDKQEKKSPVTNDINQEKYYTFKEPALEPIKKFPGLETDLNSIVAKWRGFAELVSEEKRLTLGHFFNTTQPVDISGNKISLQFSNKDEINYFNYNIDYLNKKAFEYFGKKLQFNAIDEMNSESLKSETQPGKTTLDKNSMNTGDEYVNLIIKELGGEEFS